MGIRLLTSAFVLGLLPVAVSGQLYLITGIPQTEFPMALTQVTADGTLKPVKQLVPQWYFPGIHWPAPTVEWFAISYEWRKALIFPINPETPIMVLDLDKAAVVKQCRHPQIAGMSLVTQWLADVPGRGPTFEWLVSGDDVTRPIVRGMIMDPSTPCEESFLTVSSSEIGNVVAHGTPGVANIDAPEGTMVRIDEEGNIGSAWMVAAKGTFGYQIPIEIREGLNRPLAHIIINNPQTLVISLADDSVSPRQFFAFRKRDKTWHRIPVQSDYYGRLRGFENYVAIVEGRLKKAMAAQKGQNAIYMGRNDGPGDVSAGQKEKRTKKREMGPDMEISIMDSAAVYPGRLHLYDLETEKIYTISTHMADSEILLVEKQDGLLSSCRNSLLRPNYR